MVRAGQRIYWTGRFANRDYIQDYDLVTGVIHNAALGWAVFPSARPSTGRIQVLGHGQVLATWTQPEGHGGLIAWQRPMRGKSGWLAAMLIPQDDNGRTPRTGPQQPERGYGRSPSHRGRQSRRL